MQAPCHPGSCAPPSRSHAPASSTQVCSCGLCVPASCARPACACFACSVFVHASDTVWAIVEHISLARASHSVWALVEHILLVHASHSVCALVKHISLVHASYIQYLCMLCTHTICACSLDTYDVHAVDMPFRHAVLCIHLGYSMMPHFSSQTPETSS